MQARHGSWTVLYQPLSPGETTISPTSSAGISGIGHVLHDGRGDPVNGVRTSPTVDAIPAAHPPGRRPRLWSAADAGRFGAQQVRESRDGLLGCACRLRWRRNLAGEAIGVFPRCRQPCLTTRDMHPHGVPPLPCRSGSANRSATGYEKPGTTRPVHPPVYRSCEVLLPARSAPLDATRRCARFAARPPRQATCRLGDIAVLSPPCHRNLENGEAISTARSGAKGIGLSSSVTSRKRSAL